MGKYQYVLLDWDGNLAKTLDLWLEVCREVLARRGHHLNNQEIAAGFGALKNQLESLGVNDIEEAFDEMDELASEKLPNVELYPDVLEVLELLHEKGKSLALITTSWHDTIKHTLEKYNMLKFFSVIVAGDDVTHHKPHPEPLEKAIEALGGTKDKAVMIGDSDKDLGAAANAGVDSILFFPSEHEKFYDLEKLKELKPTYIVDDLRKLLRII